MTQRNRRDYLGTNEGVQSTLVQDIPNEIKMSYYPIGFVRCGRAACRISALMWRMGLSSNECSFQPQPLVCETFENCEGLSRVAVFDGMDA